MRIVIVNRHRDDKLGGSELQCDFIAEELQKRGHEVIYVAPGGKLRKYGRSYRVVSCMGNGPGIANKVLDVSPDIVYWRFNKNAFRPAVTRIRNAGIPFIFAASHIDDVTKWVLRDTVGFRKKIKQMVRNRWHHTALRYVDALTVNNRDFLGKTDIPLQKYIPNGMKESSVPFTWPRPFVAWIANIKRVKRPELFVQLAEEIGDRGVDFLLSGHIQERGYEWLKDRKSLPDHVHYLGPTSFEESSGILAACKFMVHTCLPEGFPNVFIQSWIQSRPVVSLSFDPSGYLASEGIGFYASDRWDLFTGQVNRLLEHPDECTVMGEKAREFARNTFSVEACVDKVEELMKEVCSG